MVIIAVYSWTGNPVGFLSEEIGNNRQALKAFQKERILMCRTVDHKDYLNGIADANIDMSIEPDCLVMQQYGYMVSNNKNGPTDIQRKTILAMLIEQGVISRGNIIMYLMSCAKAYKKMNPNDSTLTKWEEDEAFIRSFIELNLM